MTIALYIFSIPSRLQRSGRVDKEWVGLGYILGAVWS